MFKKLVMMTSADICTCKLPRQSKQMLVVAKEHKNKKKQNTYSGTRERGWERGALSGNVTKLTHHRTTTTTTATTPDVEKEKMRYWWSGHAARLLKLLPSYLIPVWTCVCSCLYLHTCTKKWLLELFRASRLLMQVEAAALINDCRRLEKAKISFGTLLTACRLLSGWSISAAAV